MLRVKFYILLYLLHRWLDIVIFLLEKKRSNLRVYTADCEKQTIIFVKSDIIKLLYDCETFHNITIYMR